MTNLMIKLNSTQCLTKLLSTQAKQFIPILFVILYTQSGYADNSFYGSISPMPQIIKQQMIGNTWHTGCPVDPDDLSYLRLSYWGFDNKPHVGDMIINQQLAPEVVDIFKQLYEAHYPIERMMIPEELIGGIKFSNVLDFDAFVGNSDDTYGFFCRVDAQNPKNFSPHSYGTSIDINPYYNSAVLDPKYMYLEKGSKYLNRNLQHIGMIRENDIAVKTFMDHGWLWHGFSKDVDYMHFGKIINEYYVVNHIDYLPPDKRITNLSY